MKNIVFICQTQFGYHIDTYYYTRHLASFYNITFICRDEARPKYSVEGVNVIYISQSKSKIINYFSFLFNSRKLASNLRPSFIFVKHFSLCSILILLNKNTLRNNIDIRTGSVSANPFKRAFQNFTIFFDSCFYKKQTVISESLKRKWFIRKDAFILPLGADIYKRKSYSLEHCKERDLILFYVGSLVGRNLEIVISGFKHYLDKNPMSRVSLKIAGNYNNSEGNKLINLTEEYNLTDKVNFLGYLSRDQLYRTLDSVDIGIVHVPNTSFYDCQPSTKLFEFLLSGIPVIASATAENLKVVKEGMGLTYKSDCSICFSETLEELITQLVDLQLDVDCTAVEQFSWEKISLNLKDYIEESAND